ncbi:MAG: amidohydrolase family protein [Thermoplasmatota archaeon]
MAGPIDTHVHPPIAEYLQVAGGRFLEGSSTYFGKTVTPASIDRMVDDLTKAGIAQAWLLGWNAERASGLPAVPNDLIASAVREHPGLLVGFAGIDPLRNGAAAEVQRIHALGFRGFKVHPSAQNLRPDDSRARPIWRLAESLGLIVVAHTGTTGWGAGAPGGMGIQLEPSHPLWWDPVAAEFPKLRIVAAHAGWPWHDELLAMALHKGNVYIDISGWLPKYLPKSIWDYANGPLKKKVLFGSDYPFVDPTRILDGLQEVLKPDVRDLILRQNAERLLSP